MKMFYKHKTKHLPCNVGKVSMIYLQMLNSCLS